MCVNVFVCVRALCECVYMRLSGECVCVNVFVCVRALRACVYETVCVCGECVCM